MSIFYTNKTITMNRGDSGVVLLSILNRDDTPFALPIGMKNPTIVFSVKAETDVNDLNGNMLIEEYLPIEDYTYYGYGTPDESGQMKIHGGFYPKSKTVNTEESVIDTGIIYKVLANKKYMFVVPTTTPPAYPVSLTKREYAFAVPLVFEPAFTDRLSPGTYTYSITLLDSTSPIRFQQGDGENATTVTDFDGFLKNVTLKQDLFGSQKLILSDSPIARVHGDPIRRIYNIKPCSEESVANATASEITTGNITNIALPPVYIATEDQLGGVIVGETLQVDLRGVLDVSKVITDKIADLYAKIGDMTTLTTDEKTTLVGAINEVDAHADANKAEIGDLSGLTTDEKATLVGAINEVDSHANTGISKADAAQATADNATVLANTGISKADAAQVTADNAQQDAETAQATADNATTLANTGISKADQAQTTANTAVDKANDAKATAQEAIMKADARATSIGFMTAKDAVTALNGYPRTQLKGGDTIWIVEDGTPDLWVTEVAQESVPYNYTTKDKFNQDLVDNKVLQIGYFKTAYQESDGKPVTIAWQNVLVKSTDWVASTEFADFPYEAKIELTDFVDYTTVPQVVFNIADTMSGNYAPICKSGDKCVYIYSKVQDEITLKTVITFAPNVNGASVTGGGYNNRGKWVASTTYEIDDLVYTDNGQYVCIEGITSTTSPEQDTTHWQATFVATGKTKNGLKFSGQNTDGSAVQKTFDGSQAVEVAFDETTMTTKEVDGVLKVGAKGTIPEALPQTAGALKSGSLPINGWTPTIENFLNGYTFDQYNKEVTIYSGGYSKYYGKITGWEVLIGNTWQKMNEPYEGGYIYHQYAVYNRTGYTEIVVNITWGSYAIAYWIRIYPDGHVTGYSSSSYEANINNSFRNTEISEQTFTISDTDVTTNSDVLMELTDEGMVKAYALANGSIKVIRDHVPTSAIPYTYKVKQTNAAGQFTLVNHFVPNVPVTSVNGQTGAVTIAVPTKTSELENDSNFATTSDIPTIPTSLPVTYKKVNGELPTSGWITPEQGWKQNTLPANRKWNRVTYGDGKYVALAFDSDKGAYSTDGITWTEMSMPANRRWFGVAYGDGKFVAVASGIDKGAYSTDGITWTEMTLPASQRWECLTYGGGKFVTVAVNSMYGAYSTDGITWTQMTLPAKKDWSNVTYGDGKFVAVSNSVSLMAAYSIDGITWTETTLPSKLNWRSVTYGNGKFVALAANTQTSSTALSAYSTDGINWTGTNLSSSGSWVSVTYGDGKFVAIIFNTNKGAYSADGISWTEFTLPASSPWYEVTYGNGKFVAVAANTANGVYQNTSSKSTYAISDTSITANTSVKMYLTDEGGVKAKSKANGSITVIRDTVPTTSIPYEYEVEQTSAEGLFEVINAYVPDVPTVPTKTSELTNDSNFATTADIPTKTSDLQNDSGFITQAESKTITNASTNVSITGSAKPYLFTVTDSDITSDKFVLLYPLDETTETWLNENSLSSIITEESGKFTFKVAVNTLPSTYRMKYFIQ